MIEWEMIEWVWIAIAIAAVAAIGGVAWLGLGARKRRSEPKKEPVEPDFGAAAEAEEATEAAQEQAALPIEKPEPPARPSPPPSLLQLDICYAAEIYGETETQMESFADMRERLIKRRFLLRPILLGFRAAENQWESARPARGYSHWIFAAPLANRDGVLDDELLRVLEEELTRHCQRENLSFRAPPRAQTIENARLLDQFCAEVDLLVTLRAENLQQRPQNRKRVAELARSEGLIEESERVFADFREGERIFEMLLPRLKEDGGDGDSISTVSFVMDLPNVLQPRETFDRMSDVAEKMAKVLRFTLVDEERRPLNRDDVAKARAQTQKLASRMREYGVVAGSPEARILFS